MKLFKFAFGQKWCKRSQAGIKLKKEPLRVWLGLLVGSCKKSVYIKLRLNMRGFPIGYSDTLSKIGHNERLCMCLACSAFKIDSEAWEICLQQLLWSEIIDKMPDLLLLCNLVFDFSKFSVCHVVGSIRLLWKFVQMTQKQGGINWDKEVRLWGQLLTEETLQLLQDYGDPEWGIWASTAVSPSINGKCHWFQGPSGLESKRTQQIA